jgi:deazaflavin-dependent oxidoreductase (nitroreductase family)
MSPLSSEAETALTASSGITLTVPGRRTGRPHRVELWYVYADGALYFLAHARDHGKGTDWYRNLVAAGTGVVRVRGHQIPIRDVPFPPDVDAYRRTLALFEGKYGVGAIDAWYDRTKRIPVRAVPVPAG